MQLVTKVHHSNMDRVGLPSIVSPAISLHSLWLFVFLVSNCYYTVQNCNLTVIRKALISTNDRRFPCLTPLVLVFLLKGQLSSRIYMNILTDMYTYPSTPCLYKVWYLLHKKMLLFIHTKSKFPHGICFVCRCLPTGTV